MLRGIDAHMTVGRSSNKELLDFTLSCLWDLETARERQERLVLDALAPQDLGEEHGSLRWHQQKNLPDAELTSVQQQLSELRVDTTTEDNLDRLSTAGYYEQSENLSFPRHSRSSPCLSSYRHRSVEDAYVLDREDRRESTPRPFLPRSISAPYTCLEGIAEGTEEEENDADGASWSEHQETNKEDLNEADVGSTVRVDEAEDASGRRDVGPAVEVQQERHAEAFIVDLLQRRFFKDAAGWQDSHANPPDYCEPQRWQEWPTLNGVGHEQKASQEGYYKDAQDGMLFEASQEGYYKDAQDGTLYKPTQEGFYKNAQDGTLYKPSQDGFHKDAQDGTLCKPTQEGYFKDAQDGTFYKASQEKYYKDAQDGTVYEASQEGYYKNAQDGTLYEASQQGYYKDAQDGTFYKASQEKYHKDAQDGTVYEASQEGYYKDAQDGTLYKPTQDGYYKDAQDGTLYKPTQDGYYKDAQDGTLYKPTQEGYFKDSQDGTFYKASQEKYYKNAQDGTVYEASQDGYYKNAQDGTLYKPSQDGFYKDAQDGTLYKASQEGYYKNVQDGTHYKPSQEGYYKDAQDGTLYKPTQEGFYKNAQDGTLYEASQQGYYKDAQDGTLIMPHEACEDPRSSEERQQYGAVKPITSTLVMDSGNSHYLHRYVPPSITSDSAQQDWPHHSVEVAHRLHLPRMIQEERWAPVGQRFGKITTSHSQSEDSFLRQESTTQPYYHTVERDLDYAAGQRLWSSSADLSWEDKETLHVQRYKHLPYHTLPQPYALDHRRNVVPAKDTRGNGSDSSLSETCSPGSSSLSSDSDESSGLVWPQQLPPCVSNFSQSVPSAVVRIKASHALKRKILRFRSGSLKVMTTV